MWLLLLLLLLLFLLFFFFINNDDKNKKNITLFLPEDLLLRFFFLKFETTQLSTGMLIVGPAEEYRMIVASSSDAFLHFFKEII